MTYRKTKICHRCNKRHPINDYKFLPKKINDKYGHFCKDCRHKEYLQRYYKSSKPSKIIKRTKNTDTNQVINLINDHLGLTYSIMQKNGINRNTPFFEDKSQSIIEKLIIAANYWRYKGKSKFATYLITAITGYCRQMMYKFNLLYYSDIYQWQKYKGDIKSIIRLNHQVKKEDGYYDAYDIKDERTPLTEIYEKERQLEIREIFKNLNDHEYNLALKLYAKKSRSKKEWIEIARLLQRYSTDITLPKTGYTKQLDGAICRFKENIKSKLGERSDKIRTSNCKTC